MKDGYGSPGLGDGTGKWETIIEEASQRTAARVKDLGPQVINRPLGTVPVSKEDQRREWQLAISDPNVMAERYAQRSQAVGPEIAKWELLKWDEEMRKRNDI